MYYSNHEFEELTTTQWPSGFWIVPSCTYKLINDFRNFNVIHLLITFLFFINVFEKFLYLILKSRKVDFRIFQRNWLTLLIEDLEKLEFVFDCFFTVFNIDLVFDKPLWFKVITFQFTIFSERRCINIIGFLFSYYVIPIPFVKDGWKCNFCC